MKQVEVTILGQGYLLGCPEGGEAMLEAAVAAVDREMLAIREAGKIRARERMAVLAALNIAYQLAESRQAPAPTESLPAVAPGAPVEAVLDEDTVQRLIRRIDDTLAEGGQLI